MSDELVYGIRSYGSETIFVYGIRSYGSETIWFSAKSARDAKIERMRRNAAARGETGMVIVPMDLPRSQLSPEEIERIDEEV